MGDIITHQEPRRKFPVGREMRSVPIGDEYNNYTNKGIQMKSLPNSLSVKGIRSLIFGFLLALTAGSFGHAQTLPAFPGAEGFGSASVGGRGGVVIPVTNLNDSGIGSFRAACDATGPRIIVFRIGGTIFLQTPIILENPYLTIAGQTAPGGGIAIKNEAFRIKTHDVIVRGMRFRPGDLTGNLHPLEIESVHMIGDTDDNQVYKVILDHCSLSWSIDKNLGCWAATFGTANHDITAQWCISSEALHSPFHPKDSDHAMGMFFSSIQKATAHHNLLAHNHARQPQYTRNTWGEGINNIIYNYGTYATEVQSGAKVALIGNYYKTGADWTGNATGINVDPPVVGYGNCSVYVLGNIGPGRPIDEGNEWNAVTGDAIYRSFVPPFTMSGVVSSSATDAYDQVLENAGAFPRDAVDERIINDVINGTGQGISSQSDVGGWPTLAAGTPPTDTDNDGMPNDWEIANGLNPNDPSDGNGDLDGDGYKNVEEYINSLITNPTGGGSGEPPAVSNIPNQSVIVTQDFTPITVDSYVTDPDNADNEITWTWSGNSSLIITWHDVGRKIKVRAPNGWTGNETITFTATDPDGNSDSNGASFKVTTSDSAQSPIGEGKESIDIEAMSSGSIDTPAATALLGNYPNPFNPSTTIHYVLGEDTWVTLKIYNALGQEVATLVNEFRPAGYHSTIWDGRTNAGGSAASGVYVYRLSAGNLVKTGRMLLTK